MTLRRLQLLALVLPGMVASTAHAQDVVQGAVAPVPPVTPSMAPIGAPKDREPRGDDPSAMAPVGAHFGSFTLLPKLEIAAFYDDNIYALENKTSDRILRVSPQAVLKGDFGRDRLYLNGGIDRLEYDKNNSEARTDWRVLGSNVYDIAERTPFIIGAGYMRRHEDRGDPNSATTNLRPTLYYRTDGNIEVSRDLSTLRAGVRATYVHYNYYDAPRIGGGVTNNDDRDRSEYFVEGRVGYGFSTGYSAIIRFSYDKIDYSSALDDTGFNRSSYGLRVAGGVKFELSRLLEGEVTAGYLSRNYKDPRYNTTGRLGFNAELNWYATELTSFEVIANRATVESVAPGYSGYVATNFSLRAEHELLRTLKITATLRYVINDYTRAAATLTNRKEKFYGASAGVRYDLNRNFYLIAGYDWNKKTSTAITPGSEFNRNKLALTVGAQF